MTLLESIGLVILCYLLVFGLANLIGSKDDEACQSEDHLLGKDDD